MVLLRVQSNGGAGTRMTLIAGKLYRPRLPSKLLERTALYAKLDELLKKKMLLVSAQAGSDTQGQAAWIGVGRQELEIAPRHVLDRPRGPLRRSLKIRDLALPLDQPFAATKKIQFVIRIAKLEHEGEISCRTDPHLFTKVIRRITPAATRRSGYCPRR